ncbi:MAG TPA: glycosyltransferase family 2 protein [Candidatus Polarisedimenticolaceae bacterium]|nr:glycosyltransferase family 2 protein [Candidatus Polarisedimenticolaceae bacterium]
MPAATLVRDPPPGVYDDDPTRVLAEAPTGVSDYYPIKRGKVAVLIPAHNEEDQLGATLNSLKKQSCPPDFVLVISDNSKDDTIGVARRCGVTVIETVGNRAKKAGALNTGMRYLLQHHKELPEFLITIDADTVLERNFVERGVKVMNADEHLGGLSAVCRGKPGLGANWRQKILAWYQCAEYARAGFVRMRKNIHTMSGAGSVMRIEAVLHVLRDRGVLYVEAPWNLVEDFETTLEIKRHGWRATNNFHTVAHTDLMLTLHMLLRQRIRWVGGTIDELRRRGWKRESRASIATLIYGFMGMPLFYVWIGLLEYNILNGVGWGDFWFLGFVALYQAVTLHKLGWRSMFVGFLILPEVLYMLLRHFWLIRSVFESFTTSHKEWD